MTAPSTARRRPPGRYDEPLLAQRLVAVVLGVLFVGLLAAAAYAFYVRLGGDRVQGQVRGFDIRSDSEVAFDVEVTKPAGAKAYCVVRARAATGLEVGRDVAVLDPVGTSAREARASFVLRTTERALTAEVAGCTADPLSRDDVAP